MAGGTPSIQSSLSHTALPSGPSLTTTANASTARLAGSTPPPTSDQGVSGARVANSQLHTAWHDVASDSSYAKLFGHQSYVKNGSDKQLLGLLQDALEKAPELQGTALAQHVRTGKVGPDDIKTLQQFLQSKGYSVGKPGVDGKYGPLTHSALEHFLNGDPPDLKNAPASPQAASPQGTATSATGAQGQPADPHGGGTSRENVPHVADPARTVEV